MTLYKSFQQTKIMSALIRKRLTGSGMLVYGFASENSLFIMLMVRKIEIVLVEVFINALQVLSFCYKMNVSELLFLLICGNYSAKRTEELNALANSSEVRLREPKPLFGK